MVTKQIGTYLFLCNNRTQAECIQKRLFGLSEKHWESVKKIKPGLSVLLYNVSSGTLIGPFTAASQGLWEIDPRAWVNARPTKFPAQIYVKWEDLHILMNADEKFKFLRSIKNCELTKEQAVALLTALKEAPTFFPPEPATDYRQIDCEIKKRTTITSGPKRVQSAWEDWGTSSTVWNFSVGKEARKGAHGLEYKERQRYQKSLRYIYVSRKAFAGKLAPQLVEKLILKYSDEGDKILDPFVGTGTTLVEAMKHNRRGVGIDIHPDLIDLTKRKLAQTALSTNLTVKDFELIVGDAKEILRKFKKEEFDFILAHPPYWDLIEFSGIEGDLSGMSLKDYLKTMDEIIKRFFEIIKSNKFCAIVVGDRRKAGIVPIGFYLANIGLMRGFNLWDIIINNTRFGGKQYGKYQQLKSKQYKFHLLDHDYILVFQKRKSGWKYINPYTLDFENQK